MDIEERLKRLCFLLNSENIKSKQAAFDACYEDIVEARKLYSWELIAATINNQTKTSITSKIARNMFARSIERKSQRNGKNKTNTENMENKKEQKKIRLNFVEDKPNQSINPDVLKEYLRVCFNNKMIAMKAIENNISIDMIREWHCPNFVQLSNAIGNHIRNS